jgi:MEDS: MEthanogen/methylotroph, DcmR Sensory domain
MHERNGSRVHVTYKETIVHGPVSTEHIVQLFDDVDSLADTVSAFLRVGLAERDTALVVITPDHWKAIALRLRERGGSRHAKSRSDRLIVRDANATLKRFMRHGVVDRELFQESVGALVSRLATSGRRLRIYGEMVDLLAAEGNFVGAQQLEELWNDLREREPFTLFCGYSAGNFGNPCSADALGLICRSHSQVRSHQRDVLGSFLLQDHQSQDMSRASRIDSMQPHA